MTDSEHMMRVRMTEALRRRIADAAKANNRSMNAEIVQRLNDSFEQNKNGDNQTRWLDNEALATYICVLVDKIPDLLRDGKLPAPSYIIGPRSPRWDRQAVDAAMLQGARR